MDAWSAVEESSDAAGVGEAEPAEPERCAGAGGVALQEGLDSTASANRKPQRRKTDRAKRDFMAQTSTSGLKMTFETLVGAEDHAKVFPSAEPAYGSYEPVINTHRKHWRNLI